MTLYDALTSRIDESERTHGKANQDDVRRIADALFGEHGIKAEWFIETSLDREGNTFWEISICWDGKEVVSEWFYSREKAEEYINSYLNVVPMD
jgi:hypothetical protein